MLKISIIDSELDLTKKGLEHFMRNRKFRQDELYVGKGADLYYSFPKSAKKHSFSFTGEDYYNFIKRNFLKKIKNKDFNYISLGCGYSEREKEIIKMAIDDNYKVYYYGIDSSMNMINESSHRLDSLKDRADISLVCADFSSDNFSNEIRDMLKDTSGDNLFVFPGGTLGNVEQDYMADALSNFIKSKDYLWLDVQIRKSLNIKDDQEIFSRYISYLESKQWISFLFHPLNKMNINTKLGDTSIEMKKEDTINALKITFVFTISKKQVIKYRDKLITLLPGTKIELYDIRIYDADKLISFFEVRDFELLEFSNKNTKGQFLYRKK